MPDFFSSEVQKISLDIKILSFSAHFHNISLDVYFPILFVPLHLCGEIEWLVPHHKAIKQHDSFFT